MRPVALLISSVLVVAACSGATASPTPAPTLNLGSSGASASAASPSAFASPSAPATAGASPSATAPPTVTPTVAPTATPGPTPAPTPAAPAFRTDPEAAFGALLEPGQLPPGSEPGEVNLLEEYEFEPFQANNGIRVVSQTWSGQQFSSVFHFVYQFPTAADAESFLRDGAEQLSETSVGLKAGEPSFLFGSILDEVQYYAGDIEAFGLTIRNYNYLMRVKNFVAKVFVGGSETEPTLAEEIAFFAAQDLNTVNVPLDPNATPAPTLAPTETPSETEVPRETPNVTAAPSGQQGDFPNAEEQAILDRIPTDTRASCERVDPFYRDEIDSVTCKPQEALFVDYSSFETVADVRKAFDFEFERADPAPTEDGSCADGNLLSTFTVDSGDDPAGQIMCTVFTSESGTEFRTIVWSNERLNILGYLQSSELEWTDLIEFWSSKAGPIE